MKIKNYLLLTSLLFGALANANFNKIETNFQNSFDDIEILKLNKLGQMIWNPVSQEWQFNPENFQNHYMTQSTESTLFDNHEIFTNEIDGPVAIGNW